MHLRLPIVEAKSPGAHGAHIFEPTSLEYVPTGHGLQLSPSTRKEPAGHITSGAVAVQLTAPTFAKVSAGQITHLMLPGTAL